MGVGHLPHAWEYWDVEEERREKGKEQKIEGAREECHGRTGSHPHYTVLSQERQRPPRSSDGKARGQGHVQSWTAWVGDLPRSHREGTGLSRPLWSQMMKPGHPFPSGPSEARISVLIGTPTSKSGSGQVRGPEKPCVLLGLTEQAQGPSHIVA